MPIQAYDPEYHLIGPVKILEIIISKSSIQLQCEPEASDLLPYMTIPLDRTISLVCSKDKFFEIIDMIPKPYVVLSETDDEIILDPDAGMEEYKALCADIEEGLLQEDEWPGIIEIKNQYPLFHQTSSYCLMVGYRPMGKITDPFDLDQFLELRSNHNCFLIDNVIGHSFEGYYWPFDHPELFIGPHRHDRIVGLLELYFLLKGHGYNHEDCLQMSCLRHDLFFTLALELAKESDYYEKIIGLGKQKTEN